MEFKVKSVAGLSEVSDYILNELKESRFFAFFGDMGSGKTTLIKNICRKMQVEQTVNSPTFAIVNEYHSESYGNVYHFDFYRIKKIEEVYDIGYESYFYSDNYCFVEWPDIIEGLLPPAYIKVEIKELEQEQRLITIKAVKPA